MSPTAWKMLVDRINSMDAKVDILMDFRSKAIGMLFVGSVLGSSVMTLIIAVIKHELTK